MVTGSARPLLVKDMQGEAGLHLDEMNKLGALDPEVIQQTVELKEECKDYGDKLAKFRK